MLLVLLLGKALSYGIRQEATLRVHLEHGEMPMHNNLSELMLRQAVVGRKNWLFARSEGGAEVAATIYTLVGSCLVQGVDPFEYPTKGNTPRATTRRTQSRGRVSSDLKRVREAARRDRKMRFTALLHHVTVDRLRAAFMGMARDAAAGVDGVTWRAYQRDLEENLKDLHGRVQRGAYRARPSKRAFIPKADGRLRPLGIASLEDKVVQGAVVEVMSAIYEAEFLGFSYGFRPGRGQHDALDALSVALRKKVSWVLDADIRGFFDELDHEWLMKFVEHRIGDRRLLRLLRKWLKAGVMKMGDA